MHWLARRPKRTWWLECAGGRQRRSASGPSEVGNRFPSSDLHFRGGKIDFRAPISISEIGNGHTEMGSPMFPEGMWAFPDGVAHVPGGNVDVPRWGCACSRGNVGAPRWDC